MNSIPPTTIGQHLTYPSAERQKCGWLARYVKAIFRSDAVERTGMTAIALSLFVASKEDALHYRRAPTIWQSEIFDRLQIGSPKRLISARDLAVCNGLVHYSKRHQRDPPKYWTLVPEWLSPFFHVPKRNIAQESFSETESNSESNLEYEAEHETEPIPKDPIPRYRKPEGTIITRADPHVLRPTELSEQVWQDWLEVRKAKRASPVTRTVMERIARQAKLAEISTANAIEIAAGRGWTGFEASWNWKDSIGNNSADRKLSAGEKTLLNAKDFFNER